MSGEVEPHGALVLGLDEHLLTPMGAEALRDIDQSAAFLRGVGGEPDPAPVGDDVAEVAEQNRPRALLFLLGQRCGAALLGLHPDVVQVSDHWLLTIRLGLSPKRISALPGPCSGGSCGY
ncbi:hypothetical protein [Streptomyces sp. NPDC003952]